MPSMMSRYDEIEQFLHPRVINEERNKTREDWKKAIANAHKVHMYAKTTLPAHAEVENTSVLELPYYLCP